jgi:hypothetical protein
VTFNNTTPANFFDTLATGRASSSPFVDIFTGRDPTPNDVTSATSINTYAIQQKWLNTATNELWELKSFSTSQGVTTANWIKIGGSNNTETLTGNTGGAVPPTANNINVVGDGVYITTVGTPGTSTLTIEPAGGLTTLYTENTGTATPMAGNLNVVGTGGISTTGSGNTITISGTGTASSFVVDAHTAPGTNPVVPSGTGQITVTGGQVAAGTTANVIRTDSLAANTYTIQVQRSQAVASSTIGDNGVSHFNSAEFTVDANGFVSIIGGLGFSSIKNQVFTTSGTYTPTSGMVYCQIVALGGGGAGGGANGGAGQVSLGGGGAAGEYAVGIFSAATIGASQTVTIGAAGTGVSAANGNPGGNTSVGALISANGGGGGSFVASSAGVPFPAAQGNGGTGGSGGDYRAPGQNGDLSWVLTVGGATFIGGGGNSQLGAGALSGFPGGGHGGGAAASGYGAGGEGTASTGGSGALAGGNGTAGIVIVQEFIIA